ncbi:MAG: SIMPL domain-containing protein [Crocinitomicaceae bacterium]|nr:SIMPL domain-containing protein [Crocinitomicaceae bacterium]
MKKIIKTALLSIALIIVAVVLGNAYKYKYKQQEKIYVTGLGQEDFTSDLIVWQATFSKRGSDLKSISNQLSEDRIKIKKYLQSKGIGDNDIVFTSVNISKEYSNSYDSNGNFLYSVFSGYLLTQNLRIESKDVDKIEKISREVTELINQNIELTSFDPEYYYTKLDELKLRMIENATKDAKDRAEIIAKNGGSKLGDLKNASMGVIQITAKNSSEDYSWGGSFNTSSKLKTASITIRLEYSLK